ncbi:uncharacterized protein LOC124153636 [Ischnura elegans]|uniref:uncharacterized protein LOC124153636 n=1 Tax=Ischnura elegans TaxID=197161 RepID=UPI001ED88B00|nr:uncharacterized protein LOC124153636 [Ischnura elegans]
MEKSAEKISLQRLICKAGKKCFKALLKFSRRRPVSPMHVVTVEEAHPPVPAVDVSIAAPEDVSLSGDECDYDSFDEISLSTIDTWVAGDEAVDNHLNEALERKLASL